MQTRPNKNGEPLSILGYGCMRFTRKGAGIDLDKAEQEVLAAIDAGVNYFDTAYEDGKIDIEGLGGDRLMVFADPDFVHQVVYNIVDNAIKFTPEGGVIRFAAEKKGDMVEVSIENTGAGIAPEALPFVFERFYKEDRSRGMNTRGSGLGLHICKVLINLSGGQIHAESEEGQWCRFVFTLPAAKA